MGLCEPLLDNDLSRRTFGTPDPSRPGTKIKSIERHLKYTKEFHNHFYKVKYSLSDID